jgi:hypothetical protein
MRKSHTHKKKSSQEAVDSDMDTIQVIIKENNIILYNIVSGSMFVISIIEYNYSCLDS